jgi:hypothetical protein
MPLNWIDALAARLSAAQIPLYAALNYNGEMTWDPDLPDDAAITTSFNRHQLRDKGIGPATGPNSANETARLFETYGYDVATADSPWALGPDEASLHDALLQGIAEAAAETGNTAAAGWLDARRQSLGRSSVVIGHTDLLAIPRL